MPYYCSQGNVDTALACLETPETIDLELIYTETAAAVASLTIDDTINLKNDNIYLFSGMNDTVVPTLAVQKSFDFYTHYMSKENGITFIDNINVVHAWVTDFYGGPCSDFGKPYIVNCNYDMAGAILNTMYSNVQPSYTNCRVCVCVCVFF